MKAIQVNVDTFSKIEREVPLIVIETIAHYYDAIVNHDESEIYLVADELVGDKKTIAIPMSGERFFANFVLVTTEGDWSNWPNDWVEVRRKK